MSSSEHSYYKMSNVHNPWRQNQTKETVEIKRFRIGTRQERKWLPKSGGASSNTVVMWRGAPAAGACYSAKNLSPWLI